MAQLARVTRSVLGWPPRRAVLSVPGDSARKIRKAAEESECDCVCLDLEDAVAPSQKETARKGIVEALASLSFGRSERAVRVNPPDSPEFAHDMAAVTAAVRNLDAIIVPKVDSVEAARAVYDAARELPAHHGVALLTMCESGRGLLDLRSVVEACLSWEDEARGAGRTAPVTLQGCIFGADDYCASLELTRDDAPGAVHAARATFALTMRSFGLQPIDQVHIDFSDLEGLEQEAEAGARLGMAGKHVIHPVQVAPVHAAFSPSSDAVAYARELVRAFKQHQREGRGAFTFRGRMIDNPTFLQAQNLSAYATWIGME